MNTVEQRIRMQWHSGDFSLDVDLNLPAQGITVLYGPSGCGKTSLLRCVAGLERPHNALVQMGGNTWQDDAQGLWRPTHQRALGYVFQEASLFAHLSVRDNIAFAQRRATKAPGATEQGDAVEMLEVLGIRHLLARGVADLSGGERQRVAIARALASQPSVLLLDEPLSALDAARRQEVLPWLERLRDAVRIPMLYVTHATDEVARLADTLVVLEQGRVRACGPVAQVLAQVDDLALPVDEAGALLAGQVCRLDADWHLAQVDCAGAHLWLRDTGLQCGQAVRLRVLARDVSLSLQPLQDNSIQNTLACTVRALAPGSHPAQCLVQLQLAGANASDAPVLLLAAITARAAHALALAPGRPVWAHVKSASLVG